MTAADATGPLALEVAGVSHSYGARKALDDVSLTVAPGQFAVLLGLNGAGKSTLLSLITRLFAARVGRISIFGCDIAATPGEALRRIGVVFQARTLDLDLSIMQNLIYHAALHGIGPAEARRRGMAVLKRVGLAERAKDKARVLSGGQMRRIEIARALLHSPRLLLLDEPTVGLDVAARAEILAQVRQLVAEEKIGVLWTTHLMDEVQADDEVVVLHQGRALVSSRAADIITQTGAADMAGAFSALTDARRREAAA
ncbi:MAG TPA: ABC transporter ATP-binding protein [Rhodoblastus sp.]|nr:ABC transporter ATP-binding protein [Rhodoblastus sp.]